MGKWTFEQLSGERKTLVLADWDAPKGRPGQTPIYKAKLVARQSETYYPGNDEPSRHIYGGKHEPIELEGKFRDAFGGKGYAQRMAEAARNFYNEKLQCRIIWHGTDSPFASYVGIIESIECSPESSGVWGWKISIAIDRDLKLAPTFRKQPDREPFKDRMAQVNSAIRDMMDWGKREKKSFSTFPPSLDFGLSDFLDSVANYVNGPITMLNSMADQLEDMSKATMASIKRAQAGAHQLKTGLIKAKQAFEDVRLDAAVVSNRASEDIKFLRSQADFSQGAIAAIKEADKLRRYLVQAEQGMIRHSMVALDGDTWEAMASRSLSDASRAADIQRLNNEFGLPVPGTRYLIPR